MKLVMVRFDANDCVLFPNVLCQVSDEYIKMLEYFVYMVRFFVVNLLSGADYEAS